MSKPNKKGNSEQDKHIKLIRSIMDNMGFKRVSGLESRNFTFLGRQGELDDAFYYENILILMEYTVKKEVGEHLKNKTFLLNNIINNSKQFIDFAKEEPALRPLANCINQIETKYSTSEIQIRLFYASRYHVLDEYKRLAPSVVYFDYQVVKYFEIISKSIKKSTLFEFFEFVNIPFQFIGDNIHKSHEEADFSFCGEILPPTKSNESDNITIVTFYIDPISLLKRSYVLRNDSWKREENVLLFQRLLIPKKIHAMRGYLAKEKRVFVNNIIVALSPKDISLIYNGNELTISEDGEITDIPFKSEHIQIKIKDKPNIIGIIDGQHRVFAYHEGSDSFEETISKLRSKQNLLVTGIIIPPKWNSLKQAKFQSKLFLEINSNQQSASSQLHQELDSLLHPLSATSISKNIINRLNEKSPLEGCFAIHLEDEHKIKTASIISFALNILIRPNNQQGIWILWDLEKQKAFLSQNEDTVDLDLLKEYVDFCFKTICDFLIAVKINIPKELWEISSPKNHAILNVTTINGLLNCIRQLVVHNHISDSITYQNKLKDLNTFDFKKYKSSQYNKMGLDLYETFFK